ncbi:MAG: cytidylate kinase-like family protein [Candidatus Omnitrophota bacterium]|jgi:cytidylate kinase
MANTNPEYLHHSLKHVYSLKHMWLENVSAGPVNVRNGIHPFITISRQGGAGAHTLAEAIGREMEKRHEAGGHGGILHGWQIFDNELCQMLLEDPHLKVSLESLLKEEYLSEIEDMIRELLGGDSPQFTVAKKMFHCIRTLATVGKAIIVGRGGVCLTRDLPMGVHIRLVAPLDFRIKHTMGLLNTGEPEARKIVEEWDHHRLKLIKAHFNKSIEDPLLFDATWNTARVPMEIMASAVVDMVEHKIRSHRKP